MVLWILNAVMVRPDVMVLIDTYFRIMLDVMYTLWIVYSESVLLFCVVFSSGHFEWLFLCHSYTPISSYR